MRCLWTGVALCVALALARPAAAETFEQRVPADARGEVRIVNVAGEVQVRGWDRNEVLVQAQLGARVERVEVGSQAQRTTVEVVLPKSGGRGAAELMVQVPRASSLVVRTVSADQRIENVRGAQRLQAVSGSIASELWESDLEARTVSGTLTVRGRAAGEGGPVRLATVSGSMRLEDLGAQVELSTVSGDMDLTAARLERARFKTTNGDLDLRAGLAPQARVDAEAINGEIALHLRGAVDAMFEIETFQGDIDSCFGPQPQRAREFGPGRELRFKAGEGSGQVRIKTLNGDVEICRE